MNIMNSCVTSLVLALASPALAFQPSTLSNRPSVALRNTLRDMASYTDGPKFMSEFEQFDRNGAFSRSPQGGMDGRREMMQGQRGNPNDRMFTQDGFDPYSAYGNQFGMNQSDNRRGGGSATGPQGMGYYGEPGMMGGGRGMNGVHDDNTLGGFSYSSRVREQGRVREQQRGMEHGGPPPFYDYQGGGGGMDSGFDPRFAGGPMMGGGMEFEQQGGGYPEQQQGGGYPQHQQGGGYPQQQQGGSYPQHQEGGYLEGPGGFGGFDGGDMDLSRMGP